MATNSSPRLFTVYYMNQQKVFETRMLLDNRLKTGGSEEHGDITSNEASTSFDAEFNPPFLAKLKARLDGSIRHEKQDKVVDTLDYVNTTSRMLFDILQHCKVLKGEQTLAEGDLAYIGDISLELINEDEIRGIMAIMHGIFNGITVPDAGNLDIGRMMQSFIGDGAAFKLRGTSAGTSKPLYMKIPLSGEEMFESSYTIDDLLIGKVGIVGICKGELLPTQLRSPLDYFQKPNHQRSGFQDDLTVCTTREESPETNIESSLAQKGLYIDILSVIQAISF